MKVKVKGREFEVPELDELTFRETGTIKRLTGLRPMEWEDAFEKADPDMLLALGIIGMRRAGERVDEEALLDSPAFDTIEFVDEDDDGEGEGGPPAAGAPAPAPSGPGSDKGPAAPGIPPSSATTD